MSAEITLIFLGGDDIGAVGASHWRLYAAELRERQHGVRVYLGLRSDVTRPVSATRPDVYRGEPFVDFNELPSLDRTRRWL